MKTQSSKFATSYSSSEYSKLFTQARKTNKEKTDEKEAKKQKQNMKTQSSKFATSFSTKRVSKVIHIR